MIEQEGEVTTSWDITFQDVAGQLANTSVKTYGYDLAHLAEWLAENGLTLEKSERSDFIRYRKHLAEKYKPATAARMFSVAKRFIDEAVAGGALDVSPVVGIKGIKPGSKGGRGVALSLGDFRTLLKKIDRQYVAGLRDYAVISLMVRCGLRRGEVEALDQTDVQVDGGYTVIVIEHGKGDKRRIVKLPKDVLNALNMYLAQTGKRYVGGPLFSPVRLPRRETGDLRKLRLTAHGIEQMVRARAKKILGIRLSPHDLRRSFATLAFEGGARLEQVQVVLGHADPRTTRGYQLRVGGLADNAVDYIKP